MLVPVYDVMNLNLKNYQGLDTEKVEFTEAKKVLPSNFTFQFDFLVNCLRFHIGPRTSVKFEKNGALETDAYIKPTDWPGNSGFIKNPLVVKNRALPVQLD